MASVYSAFLQAPNTSALSKDATINYITTTTTIREPATILKHLVAQQKQVEKKQEKVLSAIEGPNSLCLETQTTLKFNTGGGAYLPGIDENLLDEKEVTLPIIHVVNFDGEGKIQEVRLYWDQGTLLKEVEAIGRTGRNWPIREGKTQVEAISKSVKASGNASAGTGTAALGNRHPNEVVINQHKKSISATRDPHASLNLFAGRDPNEEATSRTYSGPKHATRLSARPTPREYGDLFAGEETKAKGGARSPSPNKADGIVLKAGAGKNFSVSRLFDENEAPRQSSPERKKTYKAKYDHFAFGNGEDAPTASERPSTGRSSNQSHFEFNDFAAPQAHKDIHRPSDERHWGAGITEDDPESPPKRPIVHAARKDAASHFDIVDKSPSREGAPQSNKSNTRHAAVAKPKEEESFWAFSAPQETQKIYKTRGDGMGGRGDGDFLSGGGDTPKATGKKLYQNSGGMRGPNNNTDADDFYSMTAETNGKKIYKTAGDGMGGSKSAARSWGIGDDSCGEEDTNVRPSARSRRA